MTKKMRRMKNIRLSEKRGQRARGQNEQAEGVIHGESQRDKNSTYWHEYKKI
jgi:uncharacterized beta-barrel protein YwiB (DUF1934 family)